MAFDVRGGLHDQRGVVIAAESDEHSGPAAPQRHRIDARPLDGLPGHFEQQPLLRIHGQRLARADPEEARIEVGRSAQEPARGAVALRVPFPAPVLGEAGDGVAARFDEPPQILRRVQPAREPAAHSDDDHGVIGHRDRRERGRGVRVLAFLHQFPQQEPGEPARRGVVEDQRRGQGEPGDRGQPVAQLDRGQRVDPQPTEVLVRGNGRAARAGVRRRVSEHARGFVAHQVHQMARPLLGPQPAQVLGEGSPRRSASAAGRGAAAGADQSAEQRRDRCPRGECSPTRAPGDRQRDHQRVVAGGGGVEQGQSARRREQRQAEGAGAAQVPVFQAAGHADALLPRGPGQRHGGQPGGPAVVREGVQERVARRVIRLSRGAHHTGGRGVQDEGGEPDVLGRLVQVPGRVHLGPQYGAEPPRGERADDAVVEHTRRVHHRGQRMFAGDRGHQSPYGVRIGDIAGDHGDLGAVRGQFGTQVLRAGRVRPAARGQYQVPHPAFGDQMAGEFPTQAAGAAGDQDRAFRVPGGRQSQDELADVPRQAHVAERVRRPPHVPGTYGQRLQRARAEQLHERGEHPLDAVGEDPAQVEGVITHALRHTVRVPYVGLAHLEEPAAGAEQSQRRVHELAGQRVEYDVDPAVTRDGGEGRLEAGGAGGGDVVLGDAQFTQGVPFALARGGEHLRAELARQLDRRHADAARARVHEHLVARPYRGEVHQRVVRREEHQRHRPGRLPRPALRHGRQLPLIHHDGRAEPTGHHAQHPVAGPQAAHLRADRRDHARRLGAEQPGLAGVHAQGVQHVAEVDPGGPHGHPHLAPGQRIENLGALRQGQRVEAAPRVAVQSPRPVRRRHQPAVRRHARQPADPQLPGPDQRLRLVEVQQPGHARQYGACRRRVVEVHQQEPARVLRLRGPHQAPHRRGGRVGDVLAIRRDRTPCHEHQAGAGEAFLGEPILDQAQHTARQRVHGLGTAAPRQRYGDDLRHLGHLGHLGQGRRTLADSTRRVQRRAQSEVVRADHVPGPVHGVRRGLRNPVQAEQRVGRVRARGRGGGRGRRRPQEQRVHRDHGCAVYVGRGDHDGVGAGPEHPGPQHVGAGGVQRDPGPLEGHQLLAVAGVRRDVQHRVQQSGVDAEIPGVARGVRQGHLGEEFVAPAPGRPQAAERRPQVQAGCRVPVIEPVDVHGSRAGRRPPRGIEFGHPLARGEPSDGMQRPVRFGRLRGAREEPYFPAALVVGFAHPRLDLGPAVLGQCERYDHGEFLDPVAARLVAGPDGQLQEPGAGEKDHTADPVVGEPGLRLRGQHAGQRQFVRTGHDHHRAEQRVAGGLQPRPGQVRGQVGPRGPEPLVLEGVRRQVDPAGPGAREERRPVHRDPAHVQPCDPGHQRGLFTAVPTEQGKHRGLLRHRLAGRRREHPVRPELREHVGTGVGQRPYPVGEAHGLPYVPNPVLR